MRLEIDCIYIPRAITAVWCARGVIETIVAARAGATIVGCRWAHGTEGASLRKHFTIR